MFSGPNAGACPGDHDHAQGGNLLGHDVICWHGTLCRDVVEPGFDSEQLVLVLVESVLQARDAVGDDGA